MFAMPLVLRSHHQAHHQVRHDTNHQAHTSCVHGPNTIMQEHPERPGKDSWTAYCQRRLKASQKLRLQKGELLSRVINSNIDRLDRDLGKRSVDQVRLTLDLHFSE